MAEAEPVSELRQSVKGMVRDAKQYTNELRGLLWSKQGAQVLATIGVFAALMLWTYMYVFGILLNFYKY